MSINPSPSSTTDLISAITEAAVTPNDYELVRNLGRVLGITADQQVLLLSGDVALQQTLAETMNCQVTLFDGDMQHMPYADQHFDSVIVARPIMKALLPITRELARVTKINGMLGMILLNLHADYVAESHTDVIERPVFGSLLRPAAAFRAVLAESGFTAFVSTARKSDLLRNVRETYRQYLLQPAAVSQPSDAAAQALHMLTNDGVAVTLITAERAF